MVAPCNVSLIKDTGVCLICLRCRPDLTGTEGAGVIHAVFRVFRDSYVGSRGVDAAALALTLGDPMVGPSVK